MARLGSIHGRKGRGLVYMESRVWKRMKKKRWKGKIENREKGEEEKGRKKEEMSKVYMSESIHTQRGKYRM